MLGQVKFSWFRFGDSFFALYFLRGSLFAWFLFGGSFLRDSFFDGSFFAWFLFIRVRDMSF